MSKPTKRPGRLLTVLCILLILVGVSVALYPFILQGVLSLQKGEVVRELEESIDIPDASAYESVDIASMPVADAPQYSAEEKQASGNAPGLWETLTTTPAPRALTQSIPSTSPDVLPSGEASLTTQEDVLRIEESVLPTTTPLPVQSRIDLQANEDARSTNGVDLSESDQPQTTPTQNQPSSETPSPTPSTSALILDARGGNEILHIVQPTPVPTPDLLMLPPETAAPDTPDLPALPQGTATPNTPPTPRPTLDADAFLLGAFEDDDQILEAAGGTINTVAQTPSPKRTPNYEYGVDAYFSSQDALLTYTEYSALPARAQALWDMLSVLEIRYPGRNASDEIRLTIGSVQNRVVLIRDLLSLFDALPSTATAVTEFPTGERVPLEQLRQTLGGICARLQAVIEQLTQLAPDKAQQDAVSTALNETVSLCDAMQDLSDWAATFLTAEDATDYLNTRTSYTVSQTQALYLLDIPSLSLKLGCFANADFEEMYLTMRKGAALFPRVGAPNTNTNISMSAHRTGPTAFFNRLNELQIGDTVYLHTRTIGSYRYTVESITVVESDDWSIAESAKGYPTLTLVSCEEYAGSSHGRRVCVQARLDGIAR